mmetsp:Transcript_124613/g.285415  ORF Transcript_124613/g.285415 Transcript_124613/m.285415 type:complete len:209 (-) Transcript_124613:754-1380(-)
MYPSRALRWSARSKKNRLPERPILRNPGRLLAPDAAGHQAVFHHPMAAARSALACPDHPLFAPRNSSWTRGSPCNSWTESSVGVPSRHQLMTVAEHCDESQRPTAEKHPQEKPAAFASRTCQCFFEFFLVMPFLSSSAAPPVCPPNQCKPPASSSPLPDVASFSGALDLSRHRLRLSIWHEDSRSHPGKKPPHNALATSRKPVSERFF